MYAEKRFDVSLLPPAPEKPTLNRFIGWLRTKPPRGQYDFDDCEGNCLVGQYMKHCGIAWLTAGAALPSYAYTVEKLFRYGDQSVLQTRPWTYGAALKRAEKYEQA